MDILLPNGQVLAVLPFVDTPSGPIPWDGSSGNYICKFDYDVNNNLIYFGAANPGTLTSVALWQICKFSYDINNNLLDKLFANGSAAFNQIWDNRAALVYS